MKLLKVKVSGWATSFRYPSFMIGFQRTLRVPPLSTIYGFLSSAKGDIVTPSDTKVGYVFDYEMAGVDLESIYVLSGKSPLKAGQNINQREFLYNFELILYLTNTDLEKYLKKPAYTLTLGRSMDLACITGIKNIDMEKRDNVRFGKTIAPFNLPKISGVYMSLPVYFAYNKIPREVKEVREFIIIEKMIEKYNGSKLFYDEEEDWGIYIHE
jgi:CRISPR-associated protein Cas5t